MLAKGAFVRQLANVVGRRFGSTSGGLNFGKVGDKRPADIEFVLEFSDDQRQLRDAVLKFSKEQIATAAAEYDKTME